ncbi:P-loop containing nucleoside triphosphate hydrolase protein [Podospora didyma]|uniref:P-loop containing nucleoside triphosphate hydrolase protein n=1 Tax=Podospora didyma TaxID=330526 RepID=A0AAE0P421_9PEZI|nr:P-loop containing nucleoside triphosphate hydrolase protein [Podospora didyma]
MAPADFPHFPKYIPVGCLHVAVDEAATDIQKQVSSLDRAHWHFFADDGDGDGNDPGRAGNPNSNLLPTNTQASLLSLIPLSSLDSLLSHRWIQMSLCVAHEGPAQIIIRVFILPDDVDNRTVPRSDSGLRKARQALMGQLDFSTGTWNAIFGSNRSPSPPLFSQTGDTNDDQDSQDESLLEMFNNIPSPNPNPEGVDDPDARDAIYNLIDSNVPGLATTLFTYQRRSAAAMLQKETQPQKVLDPRFQKVVDQVGVPWYYDSVSGACLHEPRSYDLPRGGILAEQMGSGKTLICLSLILATKHIPSKIPDTLRTTTPTRRRKTGSLADMAAACITRNSVPWKPLFQPGGEGGLEYPRIVQAICRNPGVYHLPPVIPTHRRARRLLADNLQPTKIHLSNVSLVIVPANLARQWTDEIVKHTSGLRLCVISTLQGIVPPAEELLEFDIVLFSSTRFEKELRGGTFLPSNPLARIQFKRCIVDEGHKLGNSTSGSKSDLLRMVEHLQVAAHWIVTGTPSKGLFGVDDSSTPSSPTADDHPSNRPAKTSRDLEKHDLKRIGSIAALYLKMRPWANTSADIMAGDTPANWGTYMKQPARRKDCLKATLESLIVRHRLPEISKLLPAVDEKFVYLDGCYQDILSLNVFSMMIIFNAVQSQRTDQDYFFHPRQRKALLELVSNLKQATFFGGFFFSPAEIKKSVDTAEQFLIAAVVPTSVEDNSLIREAIMLGQIALGNHIKTSANLFREPPIYIENFPWGAGKEWSLDLKEDDPVCMDTHMVHALQRFLAGLEEAPATLQMMFESGRFAREGQQARHVRLEEVENSAAPRSQTKTLAGNTPLGQDSRPIGPAKMRLQPQLLDPGVGPDAKPSNAEVEIAESLSNTRMVSTPSAKLSYLINQVVKYQADEQIIIFYESDNAAFFLAGVLEILGIQHLIYAKSLTTERKSQYVKTFNQSKKFRVLLMDINNAAFGIDIQSASRIYFINPVLSPQVEAQAIGRARRISQNKRVTVETLVLRGSLEEVIVKRRGEMTHAEQLKCRSILDDWSIYEYIANARILPLPGGKSPSGPDQMAKLQTPQFIFGRGFGRRSHPDQDLVTPNGHGSAFPKRKVVASNGTNTGQKRPPPETSAGSLLGLALNIGPVPKQKKVRVRFADDDDGE